MMGSDATIQQAILSHDPARIAEVRILHLVTSGLDSN
jgi:hypothetical protein